MYSPLMEGRLPAGPCSAVQAGLRPQQRAQPIKPEGDAKSGGSSALPRRSASWQEACTATLSGQGRE